MSSRQISAPVVLGETAAGGSAQDDTGQAIDLIRVIILARAVDEKMTALLKQGKSHFHISGAGHEAVQIAFARCLEAGSDWAFPYYRDLAFMLALGATPREVFLHSLAKREDPMSGGRQMPCHWGHAALRVPSQSSPTGTQFLQAVGVALSIKKRGGREVVYVSSGEGTTSQGEFHEAVNWAGRDRLPVLFVIQNNRLAISVPVEEQSGGRAASIAAMMSGYEHLAGFVVDGTDVYESREAASRAVARARSGEGPSLIEARCVRLASHSSSDDQRKYRSADAIETDRREDPIEKLAAALLARGVDIPGGLAELRRAVRTEVDEAADWALSRPDPDPAAVASFLTDPTGVAESLDYAPCSDGGEPVVFVDAVNHALREELERDPSIVVFGEDVADEKGGVFTATRGLSNRFGRERVFNSPLAEASIVGVAIGMALEGRRPCVEIQFGDYIWPAFHQIRNELATIRYRSAGAFAAPMVIRVAVGGYIHGGLYHSQNIEGFFSHIPGLAIAYPSNALDAKALLKTALRLADPVLFLEHKGLYRQSHALRPEPGQNCLLPFGQARLVRAGEDLTVVTYGALVHEAEVAAARLAEKDRSVEIIDLRTIAPLDEDAIYASVRKTGKLLVLHEDGLTSGFGAEIAARVADTCFQHLDGPVRRLGAADLPIPYHPALEAAVLPQTTAIIDAMVELADY